MGPKMKLGPPTCAGPAARNASHTPSCSSSGPISGEKNSPQNLVARQPRFLDHANTRVRRAVAQGRQRRSRSSGSPAQNVNALCHLIAMHENGRSPLYWHLTVLIPMQNFDMIVIGSGPAGQRAAIQGAKSGKRSLWWSSAKCVGGACINTGTIPRKPCARP